MTSPRMKTVYWTISALAAVAALISSRWQRLDASTASAEILAEAIGADGTTYISSAGVTCGDLNCPTPYTPGNCVGSAHCSQAGTVCVHCSSMNSVVGNAYQTTPNGSSQSVNEPYRCTGAYLQGTCVASPNDPAQQFSCELPLVSSSTGMCVYGQGRRI